MARFNRLDVLLSKWALVAIVLIGMIPIVWTVGSAYEGRVFPVAVNSWSDNDTPDDTSDDYELPIVAAEYPSPPMSTVPYVDVYVQFDKVRNCDFLITEAVRDGKLIRLNRSLTWYDAVGQRLRIDFDPADDDLPISRPVGKQYAGPWRLYGTRTTQNTSAIVAHRCHPLWLTYTQFYP